MEWRVDGKLPVLKLVAAGVIALAGVLLATDAVGRTLTAVVVVGLVAWAVRDLAVPVRLRADVDGLTVHRRRLAWNQIERVRVDERQRLGLRTELLEIDTGADLYLLSVYDLGAPPRDVLSQLETSFLPR
jgi:hypothetical protein